MFFPFSINKDQVHKISSRNRVHYKFKFIWNQFYIYVYTYKCIYIYIYIYIYISFLLFIWNHPQGRLFLYFYFYTWTSHRTAELSVKPSLQGKMLFGSLVQWSHFLHFSARVFQLLQSVPWYSFLFWTACIILLGNIIKSKSWNDE